MRFAILLTIGFLAMVAFAEGGQHDAPAELAELAEPAPEDRAAGKHYDTHSFISAKSIFVCYNSIIICITTYFIFALF